MSIRSALRLQYAIPALALLALLGSAEPASASFLYDITQTQVGQSHEQFTVASIITSTTTITNFSLNTSTDSAMTQLIVDPVGKTLTFSFASGTTLEDFLFPAFVSVGTFAQPGSDATVITISEVGSAAPEPGSLGAMAIGLAALLGIARKKLPAR